MCDAEEDLRRAERDLEKMDDRFGQILRLIEDTERGIWDVAELRRKAEDIMAGAKVYA